LLNQGTARSQQVRITLNKFRLPQGNHGLSVPGADVTNTSFHRAVTLVIKAADKRYWHEEGEENCNQISKSLFRIVKNFFTRPIDRLLHWS
jgi:hypothetical protein